MGDSRASRAKLPRGLEGLQASGVPGAAPGLTEQGLWQALTSARRALARAPAI